MKMGVVVKAFVIMNLVNADAFMDLVVSTSSMCRYTLGFESHQLLCVRVSVPMWIGLLVGPRLLCQPPSRLLCT